MRDDAGQTVTREDVIARARTFLGTPFKNQGRLPGVGLDCLGVPVVAAQELGLPMPDRADYSLRTAECRLIPEMRLLLGPSIDPKLAQPGDILCYRLGKMKGVRSIRHVALLTADGTIIHAHAQSRDRCVVEVDREGWRSCEYCAFSLPGIS